MGGLALDFLPAILCSRERKLSPNLSKLPSAGSSVLTGCALAQRIAFQWLCREELKGLAKEARKKKKKKQGRSTKSSSPPPHLARLPDQPVI